MSRAPSSPIPDAALRVTAPRPRQNPAPLSPPPPRDLVVPQRRSLGRRPGAKAAISPGVYAHFVQSLENLNKIRAKRGVVAKLAEVLEESEAYYEHQCEADISLLCDAIRSAARRKDESILASFEKTLKYNGQTAEKALRTRRKNAEGEPEAEAAPQPNPAPPAGQPS